MSPIIFALTLDPFLQHLSTCMPADSVVRAYADDIGIVLQDFSSFPLLEAPFDLLRRAANLDVNVGKTVLTPLYNTSVEEVQQEIAEGGWAGDTIASATLAPLLGVAARACRRCGSRGCPSGTARLLTTQVARLLKWPCWTS